MENCITLIKKKLTFHNSRHHYYHHLYYHQQLSVILFYYNIMYSRGIQSDEGPGVQNANHPQQGGHCLRQGAR